MSGVYTFARPRAPRSAFGAILRNEARLIWRQPAGAITAIGIATLILVILGVLPVFKQPRRVHNHLCPQHLRHRAQGPRGAGGLAEPVSALDAGLTA